MLPLVLLWSCTSEPSPPLPGVRPGEGEVAAVEEAAVEEAAAEEAVAAPAPVDPEALVLQVDDRATLDTLEDQHGFSLPALLGASLPADTALSTLHAESAAWQLLANLWGIEIQAAVDEVRRPLVTEHQDALRWPAGNVGRAFDTRWLQADQAFFELAGVVNRADRHDLRPDRCGEVRFVYRLAYRETRDDGSTVGSRLPFTVNVILRPPEGTDCSAWARSWQGAATDPSFLVHGPLASLDRAPDRIELNAQVLRWPSGVETELGGQAAYLMLVTELSGTSVRLLPLENTPDVRGLREDEQKRAGLLAWLNGHATEIDQGVYRIPDRFLARRALSWSTLGVNRAANRPFRALFTPDQLQPATAPRFANSGEAQLARLDSGTCMGCHQAGSTAGFHLLGPDDPDLAGVTNRLQVQRSPHATAELPRRRAWLHATAEGRAPDPYRPHPLSPLGETVGAGEPCPLPDSGLSAPWSCDAGLSCELLGRDDTAGLQWGTCVAPDVAGLTAGMPCRTGAVTAAETTGSLFNSHAYEDRFAQQLRYDLPEDKTFSAETHNCRPPVIGVPLGRTYRRCTAQERALTAVTTDSEEICAVVGGSAFDRCVEGDFHTCLEGIVGRGMVDACSDSAPCREDYICQALPWQLDGVPDAAGKAVADAGIGFCTPTYFLFQLRLDGHPVPTVAGAG